MADRILVIKLSALGDFVQAFGPFAAIRAHHPHSRITLLTTKPFAELAAASPYFDEVWIDDKPKIFQIKALRALSRRLRQGGFSRVYDLQTSDRSTSYYRLMGGRRSQVEWSGIVRRNALFHDNPFRDTMHTVERQTEQLSLAGIPLVPPPDLAWAEADIGRFRLGERFVLMVPGGAPHRPAKRWPALSFAALGRRLAEQGWSPVLLGTAKESAALAEIVQACPSAVDLSGQTDFRDILALGRRASAAIGNDTGPMHLAAAAGCPAVVLFSAESDPTLCAPRGKVTVLRRDDLAQLTVGEVDDALHSSLGCVPLTLPFS